MNILFKIYYILKDIKPTYNSFLIICGFTDTFKYTSINNAIVLLIRNPINNGRAVAVTNFPIKVLIGTAIMVDKKPVIAAPMPAIWPIGSIAKALKFPNKNPIAKNCNPKKASKTPMAGFALSRNNTI